MRFKRILLTTCLIIISLCVGSGSYLEHQAKCQPRPTVIKSQYSDQQVNKMSNHQLYHLRGNNQLSRSVSDYLYQDINYQRVIHHLPPVILGSNMQKISDIRNTDTYNAYLDEPLTRDAHQDNDWIHGISKHQDFVSISKQLGVTPQQWGECAGNLKLFGNHTKYPGFNITYNIGTPKQMANTIITSQVNHDGRPESSNNPIYNNHNEHRDIILNPNARFIGISTYYHKGINPQHHQVPLLSTVADFSN